ncbi:two-component system, NarL family, sensor histidine kinase DegS [Peptoclostridium litorale DSM 5388]|uniref:histidine kinase n=1 Tax=Peptoclostridium litorale DSM 5388 TaxID=1121324 RepID=A0A069RGH5_PEPLI|nr:sensor histidine kinase [Peptoclostridium litorale]KDR96114.1 signal transduction histidine-protein kinase/phosphatase DegS [Peptoclostridium litorale DSM 5388]SIO04345.1 two-component system, NarL family, sensor histidine kinase DegS [Peptoclostridium litorale DSM 5388]
MSKKGSAYDIGMKKVLDTVISSIQNGQDEMFTITENIRQECENAKIELEEIRLSLERVMKEVEVLSIYEKNSRKKLSVVSKHFNKNSETDIKEAYEEAKNTQVKLILKREEEKALIKKRNDIEVRLRRNTETVQKAETFINKMTSVMDFLVSDLKNVTEKINTLEGKHDIGMKIIKAQEEERRRIARDIHDGPAQSLASLVVKSEIISKLADKNIDLMKDEVSSVKKVLKTTLRDIRRIMYDLRPTSLDDLGLVATIKRLISDIEYEKGIDVDFTVMNEEEITSPLIRLTAFRIVQEALNNACKYSQSKRIAVKLDINKNTIVGIVQDWGIGFNSEQEKSSFGIGAMKERVQLLEGKINIDSKIGKGTKVMFSLLNREVEHERKY